MRTTIVRQLSCQGLERLGIRLDGKNNALRQEGILEIHGVDSPVKILVVPTDEELGDRKFRAVYLTQ